MGHTIVDMGDGRNALLLEVSQISERRRRPVMEAMPLESAADESGVKVNFRQMMPVFDALIVCMVKAWNLKDENDQPLPVTVENVLDLPGSQYDKLRNAVQPFMTQVIPNFGKPDGDDDDSPTAASDESKESLSPEAVTPISLTKSES